MTAQKDELQTQLANEENLRFLVNERSIKLSQEAEKLKISKEKLEEHSRDYRGVRRENYYLEREGRVFKENYWELSRLG